MAFDLGKMLSGMGKSMSGDGTKPSLHSAFKTSDLSGKLSMLGDVMGGDTESLLMRIGGMGPQGGPQLPGIMDRIAGQVGQVQLPPMRGPDGMATPMQAGQEMFGRRGFRFGRGV